MSVETDSPAAIAGTPAPRARSAKGGMKTADVRVLLEKRYAPTEWALLQEVAPATGGGTRYADAIAVNLWQSRGYAIHGFEIKVSRADWLRELKNPAKAESVGRFCDHWWIVAPKGIVEPDELPPTWGLLEARPASITTVVTAPKLPAEPITREFFASLMRRGHEQIEQIAKHKTRVAVRVADDEIDRRVALRLASQTSHFDRLEAAIAKFKAETGLDINPWSGPCRTTIALAQRLEQLADRRGKTAVLQSLLDMAQTLEKAATTVRDAVGTTGMGPACGTAGASCEHCDSCPEAAKS